jgi:hypothetical protein
MIRPLRRRHRIMISVLSVIVLAAFAFGIAVRRQIPESPAGRKTEAVPSYKEVWNRIDLWEKGSIRTRLLKSASAAEKTAVELTAEEPIVRPDVIVYWVPGADRIGDALPANAFLLGSFDLSVPTPLALPGQTGKATGLLVLYSLADHEVIAVSKPITL